MNWRNLMREVAWELRVRTAREPLPQEPGLILLYNPQWQQQSPGPASSLPGGCALSSARRWLDAAMAVVFHIPTLWRLPARKRPGQLWVAWTMECEANHPRLADPAFMADFDLTMTYRLDSDVPVPYIYFYGSAANLQRALLKPPRPKRQEDLVACLISSRFSQSGRLEYVAELMKHIEVHSYGAFRRNRRLSNDQGRQSKLELIAGYRFTLAFENAIAVDYVTEKFFDPLVAGSVPVYLGAPNVERFAPGEHCYINTADFANPRALADYLLALHEDESAYNAYFTWKQRPLRPAFLELCAPFHEDPWTRLCARLVAKAADLQ